MRKCVVLPVSMPKEFAKELDKWTKKTQRTRSEFVRQAIRQYIARLRRDDETD